ncbi:hypothetical protein CMI45_00935 [Candidatus Pacearchaeota archaeon]|nr:hypothetical protein [Candidatus Pacearchaeota archaeon]
METIYFQNTTELKKNLAKLEKSLNIKIELKGRQATLSGSGLEEYEAQIVLEAMAFGFSTTKALLLKNPDFIFRKIHIRDHTRKKSLKEVKARIIGTKGKTLRTLENVSDAHLILKDNEVGIIAQAESIPEITTALTNLIRGTKQSNVYHYLEKVNKTKKEEGLGIK